MFFMILNFIVGIVFKFFVGFFLDVIMYKVLRVGVFLIFNVV